MEFIDFFNEVSFTLMEEKETKSDPWIFKEFAPLVFHYLREYYKGFQTR
jgi:hypothetical protein